MTVLLVLLCVLLAAGAENVTVPDRTVYAPETATSQPIYANEFLREAISLSLNTVKTMLPAFLTLLADGFTEAFSVTIQTDGGTV